MTYIAVFYLLANPSIAVGPTLGGFDSRAECASFAFRSIVHLKAGMGESYQPIGFRCVPKT